MFLYQIEAKQVKLRELYKERKRPALVLKEIPMTPDGSAVVDLAVVEKASTEKTIAVALPVSLHTRAQELMQSTGFTGSKREFINAVLQSAFKVLED